MSSIQRLIIPPVKLEQYIIFWKGSEPVGFLTWGLFSEGFIEAYLRGEEKITPETWLQNGDQPFVTDFAVIGDAEDVIRAVKRAKLIGKSKFPDGATFRFRRVHSRRVGHVDV